MRYGGGEVSFSLPDGCRVTTLEAGPYPAIDDLPDAFSRAISDECVDSPPLASLLSAEDSVTIVVSDITRSWMRQDAIIRLLMDLFERIGIPDERVTILIAIGTHRKQSEDEMRRIVSPEIYRRVRVVNHDCDAEDLVYVGTTRLGTRVTVNPLVLGRKVILIGGTVHHLMSGFGGGRKSIVPGVSARATVYQNHRHALAPRAARSNEAIGMGVLEGNPIHEDMLEAAYFVNPAFGVNLVVRDGRFLAICCGHWRSAWEKSCRIAHAVFGVPIAEQSDIVIASCGGYPRDIDLYQGAKSLLNASQAVRPGGSLVFLAECGEGGGPEEFFGWIDSLCRGTLDMDLRADFTIAGYIFYAACEAISRAKTYMLTGIDSALLAPMRVHAGTDLGELLGAIDFSGKTVCLMPMAGNTMPYMKR
ncbi:MAG: nickel-dependent lactate racemase [Clostridia bacterium]|nr:nickel-dependent lactate racemase [Clostridia bacterium]